MYSMYFYGVGIGRVMFPITPSKIDIKINGANKTVSLVSGQEINQIKTPKLTDISMTLLLPNQEYAFARYLNGYKAANYFLDMLEKFKLSKKPFKFILTRETPNFVPFYDTNMMMTLESYTISESVENGFDVEVSIKLKQYVTYGTKVVKIETKGVSGTVKKNSTRTANKEIPSTYTVKQGDTLWAIAKKLLGDGAKCWNLAKLNGISNPNIIRVGQVLKIQDVEATTAPASSKNSNSSKVNTKLYQSWKVGSTWGLNAAIATETNKTLTGIAGYSDDTKLETDKSHSSGSRSLDGSGTSSGGRSHSGGGRGL